MKNYLVILVIVLAIIFIYNYGNSTKMFEYFTGFALPLIYNDKLGLFVCELEIGTGKIKDIAVVDTGSNILVVNNDKIHCGSTLRAIEDVVYGGQDYELAVCDNKVKIGSVVVPLTFTKTPHSNPNEFSILGISPFPSLNSIDRYMIIDQLINVGLLHRCRKFYDNQNIDFGYTLFLDKKSPKLVAGDQTSKATPIPLIRGKPWFTVECRGIALNQPEYFKHSQALIVGFAPVIVFDSGSNRIVLPKNLFEQFLKILMPFYGPLYPNSFSLTDHQYEAFPDIRIELPTTEPTTHSNFIYVIKPENYLFSEGNNMYSLLVSSHDDPEKIVIGAPGMSNKNFFLSSCVMGIEDA